MIGIINYGMGNLQSVKNALDYLGFDNIIIDNPNGLAECSKIILPGVGAFDKAMCNLDESGFSSEIKEFAINRKLPMLGICLGMQLLLEDSTEYGYHAGLGLIKGKVRHLGEAIKGFPIPHIGWNNVCVENSNHLMQNIVNEASFYFVHSYYCSVVNRNIVEGITKYGIEFDSVIESENIFGCQFHPEKSQKCGLELLRNFGNL